MELNQFFYKNLAHCLADPLASMFNTFLEANFVPNGCLTAHVNHYLKREYVPTVIITDQFH